MTEIDPQQFGEMKEAVKTLKTGVKDLGKMLKLGLKRIHQRIDDHMNNEEEEQREHSERLRNIEASLLVWKTRWAMAIAILGFLGNFLGDFLIKTLTKTLTFLTNL